jgi:indolepyruvate ferredoxin oxidoreductase
VARLHLKNGVAAALATEFPGGVKVQYNLHPPLLRAMGMKQKLRFGTWFDGAFKLLYRMRGVRGSALDIFGRAEVRRVERALIAEYRALIEQALQQLTSDTHDKAVKLAALPDVIRGYEDIKLRNVAKFREQVAALGFPR